MTVAVERIPIVGGGRPRGFTLIELIITIGILVLLAAITVSAMVALGRKSEVTRTDSTLRLLDAALTEWQANASRNIRWGVNTDPTLPYFEMDPLTPHVFSTTELLSTLRRNKATETILAQIEPQLVVRIDSAAPRPFWVEIDPSDPDPNAAGGPGLYDSTELDGELVILDAWGTPIRAVHAGRGFFTGDAIKDADGTLRTDAENLYGVATSEKLYFVSAGPDKRFGQYADLNSTEPAEEMLDNLYSYEPVAPGASP